MKTIAAIILLVGHYLSATSYANNIPTQTIHEVSTDQLLVLGRAIESRSTGEQIALACIEHSGNIESCKKIRFVWIHGSSAFLFGSEIEIKQESDLKGEVSKTFKSIKKQLKKERKTDFNDGLTTVIGTITAAGGAVALFILVPPGLREAAFISWFIIVPGTIKLIEITNFNPFAATMGSLDMNGINTTRTAEGWNWSIKPKRINHHKFFLNKKAIDRVSLNSENYTGEGSQIKLELIAPSEPICRVNWPRTQYFSANERAEIFHEIILAQKMANELGCAFVPDDQNAEYHFTSPTETTKKSITRKYEIVDMNKKALLSKEVSFSKKAPAHIRDIKSMKTLAQ